MRSNAFVGLAFALAASAADAFGPEGHLIAGVLAEPALCEQARAEIRALDRAVRADLSDFTELGLWADRIRSDPDWRHSAPWHYMNVETDAATLSEAERAIRAHAHPSEGDVLTAIERFSKELADRTRSSQARGDALRFLVHFVVDIHQPLHVGRAADRGGNEVEIRFDAVTSNLHRFWDTDVIGLRDLSPHEYAALLAGRAIDVAESVDPILWAAESLVARQRVYADLPAAGVQLLDADYLRGAQALTEQRLIAAGRRLASTLNRLLCR
jgi:S1/P1 Nuclease